jgi:type I restriction enzyme S subunit
MELPIPSIEKQREIVKEYNTVVDRIKLNEELNKKLEETAQALYKHWFVDFEFPNEEGKPYKSSGGAMQYNEELGKCFPSVWSFKKMNELVSYSLTKVKVENISKNTYLSTENMLPNRGGVVTASALPSVTTVTKFSPGEVLISNIRPYFKKIWLATFEGGCSNDILCFKPQNSTLSLFAYYTLEQDSFFEYVMKGAKGTKMPRGDKKWIMEYLVSYPDIGTLESFINKVEVLMKVINTTRSESGLLINTSKVLLSKMTQVGA